MAHIGQPRREIYIPIPADPVREPSEVETELPIGVPAIPVKRQDPVSV